MRETCFGVELHAGDRCFVLYADIPPREGTIIIISEEKADVQLDDGTMIKCDEDRLTLSFKLLDENEKRRRDAS